MTPKQQRFVAEYLIDLNATQAAIRAGYAPSGARTEGARLLANADIVAAIATGQAEHAEKAGVTVDRIIEELALIGFAHLGHEHVRSGDKRAALVNLGEHLGMFSEKKVKVDVGGDGFSELVRALEIAARTKSGGAGSAVEVDQSSPPKPTHA